MQGLLKHVQSFNLSANPVHDIGLAVKHIKLLMPHLIDLQISLNREQDAELIIRELPTL